MRDDRAYLLHIRDCADRILLYISEGHDSFLADPKTQDAVMRNLEIIGEAVKNLSEELREQHPNIPWKRIAGMRDVLIHHYFDVKIGIVLEHGRNSCACNARECESSARRR